MTANPGKEDFMNNILDEMFPVRAINKKCDDLLSKKPEGFHPIAKRKFRIECEDVLNSYESYKKYRNDNRVFRNTDYFGSTKERVNTLQRIVGR